MKKILLGTTAIVTAAAFTAPAFAADKIKLGLRGYFTGGMAYYDLDGIDDVEQFIFGHDSEVHFRGSTTLDNGLKVSFRAELELENDADSRGGDSDADTIDEVYIQFDGGFGRVQFGQQDGVGDQMVISAPNVFGEHTISSIDLNPFEAAIDSTIGSTFDNSIDTSPDFTSDNTKLIYFTPRFAGFQIGLSYMPVREKNANGYDFGSDILESNFGNNYIEIAGTWKHKFNGVGLGLSASYGEGDKGASSNDPNEWHVGGEIEFGGFTFGAAYKEDDNSGSSTAPEEEHFDLGFTYETGPWTLGLAYGSQDNVNYNSNVEQDNWIGGLAYKFGPGMELGLGGMFYSVEDGNDDIDGVAIFTEIDVNF